MNIKTILLLLSLRNSKGFRNSAKTRDKDHVCFYHTIPGLGVLSVRHCEKFK